MEKSVWTAIKALEEKQTRLERAYDEIYALQKRLHIQQTELENIKAAVAIFARQHYASRLAQDKTHK